MKSIFTLLAAIALFFLFTAESCDRAGTALNTQKAASYLLGTKDSTSTVIWKKVARYDPYNGGQERGYQDYATYMTLHGNGTYEEKDPENAVSGRYYLNKTKTAIAFVMEMSNGESMAEDQGENMYRHEIIKYENDTLILAIQGRHGMVKDTYVKEVKE